MTKYKFHKLRTEWPQLYNRLRWQRYKKEVDRIKHWKEQVIKDILQTLITNKPESFGQYQKGEIEKAIMEVRGVDKRTVTNWFNTLWKFGYFSQPQVQLFELDLNKIATLEVKIPLQHDEHQKRLTG